MLKFSNATQISPVVGFTVGTENWLSSHPLGLATANSQYGALPLIRFFGDHERPWSSE